MIWSPVSITAVTTYLRLRYFLFFFCFLVNIPALPLQDGSLLRSDTPWLITATHFGHLPSSKGKAYYFPFLFQLTLSNVSSPIVFWAMRVER